MDIGGGIQGFDRAIRGRTPKLFSTTADLQFADQAPHAVANENDVISLIAGFGFNRVHRGLQLLSQFHR